MVRPTDRRIGCWVVVRIAVINRRATKALGGSILRSSDWVKTDHGCEGKDRQLEPHLQHTAAIRKVQVEEQQV